LLVLLVPIFLFLGVAAGDGGSPIIVTQLAPGTTLEQAYEIGRTLTDASYIHSTGGTLRFPDGPPKSWQEQYDKIWRGHSRSMEVSYIPPYDEAWYECWLDSSCPPIFVSRIEHYGKAVDIGGIVISSGLPQLRSNPYRGLNHVSVDFWGSSGSGATIYEAFAVMDAAGAQAVSYHWFFPEFSDTRAAFALQQIQSNHREFEDLFWRNVSEQVPTIDQAGCWEAHTCPEPTVYAATGYARLGSLRVGGVVTEVDFGSPAGVEIGGHAPTFFQVFQRLAISRPI
jgi:hypothetical protein